MNKVLGLIQHYILHKATEEEIDVIRHTITHRHNPNIVHLSTLHTDPVFLDHIKTNHLLQAVKYVKDRTGIGLKEAKDFVDQYRAGKSWT